MRCVGTSASSSWRGCTARLPALPCGSIQSKKCPGRSLVSACVRRRRSGYSFLAQKLDTLPSSGQEDRGQEQVDGNGVATSNVHPPGSDLMHVQHAPATIPSIGEAEPQAAGTQGSGDVSEVTEQPTSLVNDSSGVQMSSIDPDSLAKSALDAASDGDALGASALVSDGNSSSTTSTPVGRLTAGGEGEATIEATGPSPSQPLKKQKFFQRVVFGLILGLSGAFVIVYGQLLFLAVTCLVAYQASQEYNGFLTSSGITAWAKPTPSVVGRIITFFSVGVAIATYCLGGKSGASLAVSSFLVLCTAVVAVGKPTFSHLTTSVFGLFYCGLLPSFWLKLRLLDWPAPELPWPALSPLIPSPTVGLMATFTTVACIIAADTGAYFVGKKVGRTKLTDISPKKTVEGAMGGMCSSIVVAVGLCWLTGWLSNIWATVGLGVLTFFASIFGDLIESIMKREAGMKDSGDLIPGHGGLLDRFDSYMFTGAMAFFYVAIVLPRLGVL